VLKIINYPHPTLRHPSKPLKRVDAELRAIVERMFELMYEHKGVGLAANQVDLPYRLFVANVEGDPDAKELEQVYINPVLTRPKGSAEAEEGCLSIPGVYADVRRPEKITVHAFSLSGEETQTEVDGLLSRIIQHETDHLDGRLFIDRLSAGGEAAVREKLLDLENEFVGGRERGEIPSDEEISSRLAELEKMRT